MRDGPAFFSQRADRPFRRRRIAFIVVMLVATLALIWPVYDLFGDARPFVLGLPLSMAWVVAWILVIFAALLMLYRSDSDVED